MSAEGTAAPAAGGTDRPYDVCVVGAGAMGLYTAGLLAATGQRVVVLEAGAARGPGAGAELVPPVRVPAEFRGARLGRACTWGGTTTLWGGQLWPWSPEEFTRAAAHPGVHAWSYPADRVLSRYPVVRHNLGLGPQHDEVHASRDVQDLLPPEVGAVRQSSWMSAAERDFSRNPTLGARLEGVDRRPGAPVRSLRHEGGTWSVGAGHPGGSWTVRARIVVLAAGTFGNVALLSTLEGAQDLPALGKGFMDHVSGRVARLDVVDWAKFRAALATRRVAGTKASLRIVAPLAFQQRSDRLPCFAHLEVAYAHRGALAGLLGGDGGRRGRVRSAAALLGAGARIPGEVLSSRRRGRLPVPSDSEVYLRVDVQQPVRPEVNLVPPAGEGPGLDLRWRVHPEEVETAADFGSSVAGALAAVDAGVRVGEVYASPDMRDTYHQMGGARSGDDPTTSVVTTDLQVHGRPGLYVVGASTFASGGRANPTFTALAMATGLVDDLSGATRG